jgi:hypothetical protein
MKSGTILLGLSLLANVALVAVYLAVPANKQSPATAPARDPVGPASPDGATPALATRPAQPALSWATIDTPDIDELARRLKAAGFTPGEVRLILSRRIFSPGPAGVPAKPTPYWRPAYRYESPTGQDSEARRKQMAEQQRLSRKYLMSPEGIAEDLEQLATAKRQWGDLPLEKLQAIARIDADYQELGSKQYLERGIRPGEENTLSAVQLLMRERLADIARVLTPEEYAAYELRASPLAGGLRYQLETFNATEEEYKVIFGITKTYYHDRWYDPQLGPEARKALNAEILAKVSAALGADRALDYDAAVNQNSRDQTAGLVSRLGLPARVASEVRQVQQDLTQRAKDIRANTGLSLAERNAQLAALARQAESQLTTKLGANGYEAYNDIKGDWIRALQPKPGP